jgi:hypothetical protein
LKIAIVIFITLLVFLLWAIVYPRIIKYTGKLWNGAGTVGEITRVTSFSTIPFLPLLLFELIFLFNENSYPQFEVIKWILRLISMVILVKGIAKVQKFDIMTSVLNILIPSLIPILIFILFR